MTNGEIIEQLENTIGLIKQDGKDWLDDRDIPILEACIKALTALDKLRAELLLTDKTVKDVRTDGHCFFIADEIIGIIDKYRNEVNHETDN